MDTNAELESLRKVHGLLMEAVKTAESAVNAQLAQRRFWLEEICSNIDEEGNLQSTSIWKRPVTVKVPPGKKGSSLKRKKNSLESSSEKPAKKPRTKKESETTRVKTAAAKPPLKRGPTVKIKMRTLPVSAEKRPPSPDSDATESQKDDDDEEDDDGSFSGSYPVAQPSEHNSDSESAAANATFGVHSAAYHPEARDVDGYQPMMSPMAQNRPPQHHYAPHGVRTYTSLEDVVASDDDTDEDVF